MSREPLLNFETGIIDRARIFCESHKERLTKPRLEVLRIFTSSDKPLRAYEILQRLGKVLFNPKPPTAYRAIDFWLNHGFIHRIESLNAYILCQAEHRHQGAQFMICNGCGHVTEAHVCSLPELLENTANSRHFSFTSWSVEMHGKCFDCSEILQKS